MLLELQDVIKVVLAIVVGGLIGVEREFRDKAAGFRTMIFICVGSTLFTIFSLKFEAGSIVANVATGIGFIGAGVIMREGGRITGLTTAAMIWLTAALGVGIGWGNYLYVALVTGLALAVIWLFPFLEHRLDRTREHYIYQITFQPNREKLAQLQSLLRQSRLRVASQKQCKVGNRMRCTWETFGPPEAHASLLQALLADPEVEEVIF